MASASLSEDTVPQRRRKQLTYGKHSHRNRAHFQAGSADQKPLPRFEQASLVAGLRTTEPSLPHPQHAPHAPSNVNGRATPGSVTPQSPGRLKKRSRPLSTVSNQLTHASHGHTATGNVAVFDVPLSDEDDLEDRKNHHTRLLSGHTSNTLRRPVRVSYDLQASAPETTGRSSSSQLRPPKRLKSSGAREPATRSSGVQRRRSSSVSLPQSKTPNPLRTQAHSEYKERHSADKSPKYKADKERSCDTQRRASQQSLKRKSPHPEPADRHALIHVDRRRAKESSHISAPSQSEEKISISPKHSPKPSGNVEPSTPHRNTMKETTNIYNTPRQVRIWSAILPDQTSPSDTALKSSPPGYRLSRSQKPTAGRMRLIDTLVAKDEEIPRSDEKYEDGEGQSITGIHTSTAETNSQNSHPESATGSQPPFVRCVQSKVTYAGPRSYLDDSHPGANEFLAHPLDSENGSPLVNGAIRSLSSAHQQADRSLVKDHDDEEGDLRGMRSIHELRAAADSFRFEHDLFFDDIERTSNESLSRKRNALLEICTKLSEETFRERFVQNGLELRVIVACQDVKDPFVCSAVAGLLINVLLGPNTTQLALQLSQVGAIDILMVILEYDEDLSSLAQNRRSNMSKITQRLVTHFHSSLRRASFWDDVVPTKLSPRLLSIRAWELLVRKIRKDGEIGAFLSKVQLSELLRFLETAVQDVVATDSQRRFAASINIKIILSLLESLTIAEACATDNSIWDSNTLTRLIGCFDKASLVASDADGTFELILRTCLNLANNHRGNSMALSNPAFIEKITASINQDFSLGEDCGWTVSKMHKLDRLLLALGAMLNLAEWSDSARLAVLDDSKGLDNLLQTFVNTRAHVLDAESLAASRGNVAYGYLAVLLGNLCKNETVRNYIRSKLPNGSFEPIAHAIDEFLLHHEEADKVNEGNDSWIAFTRRLAAVGDTLQEYL